MFISRGVCIWQSIYQLVHFSSLYKKYSILNSLGSSHKLIGDLVELALDGQINLRCTPLDHKSSNESLVNDRDDLHISGTAEFLELLGNEELLLLLKLDSRAEGGHSGVSEFAVLGFECLADFRNGIHSVLVDENVKEVDGVRVETALGSNALDQILLLLLVEGGVGQEVLNVGIFLHHRGKGIDIGVDGLKGALGLCKTNESVGVRSTNSVVLYLQRGKGEKLEIGHVSKIEYFPRRSHLYIQMSINMKMCVFDGTRSAPSMYQSLAAKATRS